MCTCIYAYTVCTKFVNANFRYVCMRTVSPLRSVHLSDCVGAHKMVVMHTLTRTQKSVSKNVIY